MVTKRTDGHNCSLLRCLSNSWMERPPSPSWSRRSLISSARFLFSRLTVSSCSTVSSQAARRRNSSELCQSAGRKALSQLLPARVLACKFFNPTFGRSRSISRFPSSSPFHFPNRRKGERREQQCHSLKRHEPPGPGKSNRCLPSVCLSSLAPAFFLRGIQFIGEVVAFHLPLAHDLEEGERWKIYGVFYKAQLKHSRRKTLR